MDFSERRSLLLDGLDAGLKSLATVPQDEAISNLIADAQRLRREVESWQSAPDDDEVQRVEQRVLALHVAIAAQKR